MTKRQILVLLVALVVFLIPAAELTAGVGPAPQPPHMGGPDDRAEGA